MLFGFRIAPFSSLGIVLSFWKKNAAPSPRKPYIAANWRVEMSGSIGRLHRKAGQCVCVCLGACATVVIVCGSWLMVSRDNVMNYLYQLYMLLLSIRNAVWSSAYRFGIKYRSRWSGPRSNTEPCLWLFPYHSLTPSIRSNLFIIISSGVFQLVHSELAHQPLLIWCHMWEPETDQKKSAWPCAWQKMREWNKTRQQRRWQQRN